MAVAERVRLLDLSRDELRELMLGWGQPAYRADQIRQWLYKQLATDVGEMSSLPRELRARLAQETQVTLLEPVAETTSRDAHTIKVLFRLPDGQLIETVLMGYDRRHTVCISSQAGCAMGCAFCATAQMGLQRNLTPGEIVAQVLYFERKLREGRAQNAEGRMQSAERGTQNGEVRGRRSEVGGEEAEVEARWVTGDDLGGRQHVTRITNVVVMGMGEPLANYANLWQALHNLVDPDGFGLGARRITVSTVGLVPGIDRFAEEDLRVNLAVSLHAPDDDLRSQLVPINVRYPIAEVMAACRRYVERTHRRITFEYALMRGINDSRTTAEALADLLQGLLCHVNLIPLNPVAGSPYQPSQREDADAFVDVLRGRGIAATLRVRRGIDIDAGCGQLRARVQGTSSG